MANNRNLDHANYGVSLPDDILGYVRINGDFPSPNNRRRDHHLRLPPRDDSYSSTRPVWCQILVTA